MKLLRPALFFLTTFLAGANLAFALPGVNPVVPSPRTALTSKACGLPLSQMTPEGVVNRLAEDRELTADEERLVLGIIDQYEDPDGHRERRVREGLDAFKADPKLGPYLKEDDVMKGMSGYWTRNALAYVLKGRNLTADQKARAFNRFAKIITARTASWSAPWRMAEVRNDKGDIAFLGAIHVLVILNEPGARMFKGIRPMSHPVSGKTLTDKDNYFATWDPRRHINSEIFEATDAVPGQE